ncbi:hypothetical protein [Streptomyces stelliscabiei]|uniref:hypothetical protein n=1 Tax=Streptomyces stelliscabiei TaxID=146820 RepID=UPI002FF1A8CD
MARRFPSLADLHRLCRSPAMLDAILSPDRDGRYHSFDAGWAEGDETASMHDGSGDEYSIVFSADGAYVRGFAHESPMSPYGQDHEPWPGVLDDVPEVFRAYVEEPAFTDEDDVPVVTACLWRRAADDRWQHGTIDFPVGTADPDGSAGPFALLVDRTPEAYRRFAEDHYEVPADLEAVRQVYALRPLSPTLVSALNPARTLADLAEDIAEIAYPQPGADAHPLASPIEIR